MPNIEFLIARGGPPASLDEAADTLHDHSVLFVYGWKSQDIDMAVRASRDVFQLFDYIVGLLTRARDDIKSQLRPSNPSFLAALEVAAGKMVSPVTLAEQQAVVALGQGNGQLPNASPRKAATLGQVLNKIKHQNTSQTNFRIDGNQHLMLVCANKQNGRPDCALEFDVQHFCQLCKIAWSML